MIDIPDEKTKEMFVSLLQSIIDDMGGLSAKKLLPEEKPSMEEPAVAVEIEAKPMDELHEGMESEEEEMEEENPTGMGWKKRMNRSLDR